MSLDIVILAAGQGKRMCSDLPKVLHCIAGKPLLEHVIQTAELLKPNHAPIVVCGHGSSQVQENLAHRSITWALQSEQLGTAHALQQALPSLNSSGRVLVLCGDVPLITAQTLKNFIDAAPSNDAIGIVTAHLSNPTGLGRIIRDTHNMIQRIVEEKDAKVDERAIKEINAGIYVFPVEFLQKWLPTLKNHNAQKEYYLTDLIALAVQEGHPIFSTTSANQDEILGVNDRIQLAYLERCYQKRLMENLMRGGVSFYDPARVDIRGDVTIGQDTTVDINVILEGTVNIGKNCIIGPNTILRNVSIDNHVEIKAHSIIDGAEIASHCVIGPFARIRPFTKLQAESHIGNFVEIKNSEVGVGSKINHLSYIGDSLIGSKVNIGAGTITCNYDGVTKHRTIIHDKAFIGSNSQLVAPITIGEGATIAAGSTITRDAPAYQLTISRAQQRSIPNWQRPTKEKEK